MFDAGASAETLGDLTAHIGHQGGGVRRRRRRGCGALAEKVDYLVSCFSSPSAAEARRWSSRGRRRARWACSRS